MSSIGNKITTDYILDRDGPHGIAVSSWIERGKTALLIVDMQNYMTRKEYAGKWSSNEAENYYYSRLEEKVLPNVRKLARAFRDASAPVVYFRIGYTDPNLADVPAGLTKKRYLEDLEGRSGRFTLHIDDPAASIDDRIAPEPDDIVIVKGSSGAFCTSTVDLTLRSNGISRLVVTGGITEGCVESTLREGFDKGYLCTLAEDCCISSREKAHRATVNAVETYFGWAASTEELLKALGSWG